MTAKRAPVRRPPRLSSRIPPAPHQHHHFANSAKQPPPPVSAAMAGKGNTNTTTAPAPRIGHKKSRNGCLKCRSRRVKCDETRPECKNCCRLGLQCRYATNNNSGVADATKPSLDQQQQHHQQPVARELSVGNSSSSHSSGNPSSSTSSTRVYAEAAQHAEGVLGESRARRLMELRLLQFWMEKPARMPNASAINWLKIWCVDVPALATQHDHLLYALFSFAATQLSSLQPNDEELAMARQTYWSMALHEQRVALSNMNNMDGQVTSLAGYLIAMNSFSMLKQRVLEPYVPPLPWFETSQGAQRIAETVDSTGEATPLGDLLAFAPTLSRDANANIEHEYQRILDPYLSASEFQALQSTRPYEAALRYISTFRRAIIAGEAETMLLRRVVLFPYLVRGIHPFIRESRPRALVVLGCFFSLVAQSRTCKFVGDPENTIPKREVAAVNAAVPDEWRALMALPMDETFGDVQLRPTGASPNAFNYTSPRDLSSNMLNQRLADF